MNGSLANSARERYCLLCALGAAITSVVTGALVVLGWALDIQILKSLLPGYASMKPLTAICFVSGGMALALYASGPTGLSKVSVGSLAAPITAFFGVFISLASIVEYALHLDVIDELLFRQPLLATHLPQPGRIAPGTALALLLITLALAVLDAGLPKMTQSSEILALLAALMGLAAILRHLYGVEAVLPFFGFLSGELPTALLLFLLAVGTLLSRPHRALLAVITSDLFGGWIARRFLPVAFLAPIGITWLRVAVQRAGFYGPEFGLAMFAVANVTIFTAVVWLGARSLNRLDRERRLADQATRLSTQELASTSQQLLASEERFRLFMSHLPASAFIKDHQGRYVWGNAAWRRQFPDDWGDLTGKTDADLWPADTAAVFGASDTKVRQDGVPYQLAETTRIAADVRQRLVTKFPIQAPGGDTWIGGVAFDTTDSKRLETQLYQAQKLEAIGLLAGGVAHDFNNLLTIILGYAGVGKNAIQDVKTLLSSLDEIENAALRAAALTKQLLAFGRKQVMQPRIVSVNDELTEIHPMLRRIIREDIALKLTLAPDIGVVKADPVQIQQILINLTMNAQDAMPDGGRLTIETANVDLDESYALIHRDVHPGTYVQLAVSDTGTGMDAVTLARIFEPFFTTKSPGKGTGLGLATVYGIVKQNGGHVWVYSEPGKGTAFKIYLPRVEGAEVSRDSEVPRVEPRRVEKPKNTLLIVEDEDALRSLMVKACRDAGYHVLEAHRGEDAVALIANHPGMIDLLVTDVIMPGISGRTLADQIVKNHPETRILFCSGYAENAVVHHGVLAPDVEFLQKPFSPAVLLHRIRLLLDGS